jgi:hypothetical protein
MINHDSLPANMNGQRGSAILSIVIGLGLVMLLVQGSTWYRSNEGVKFMGKEKKKVVAMQMAEAGVEENIADLAKRTVRPAAGVTDLVTYNQKALEGGRYSSTLSTVGVGPAADTVDVVSNGSVGSMQQSIRARLKLNKYLDTTLTVITYVEPETTSTVAMVTVTDVTESMPSSPAATPALNTTAAYSACISGAPSTCRVCHLPFRPDTLNMVVLTQSKGLIPTHNSHLGDYITMDGTCDLYRKVTTITYRSVLDTTYTIVDKNVYDSVAVVDTSVKVQVLSWR